MANEAYGTSGDGMFGWCRSCPTAGCAWSRRTPTWVTARPRRCSHRPNFSAERADDRHERDRAVQCTQLTRSSNPSANPKTVRYTYGSSSACLGAFHQYHAVKGAAQALFLQSAAGGPCVGRARAGRGRTLGQWCASSRTASRRFRGRRCSAPSRSWACRRWRPCMLCRLLLEGHLSVRVGQCANRLRLRGGRPRSLLPDAAVPHAQARRSTRASTGARPMRHRRRSSACPSIRRTGA